METNFPVITLDIPSQRLGGNFLDGPTSRRARA